MKYVITGSLGNISRPLATGLVKAGHAVSVITHREANRGEIEAIGAKALVGSVEDAAFIRSAFADADAVYLMIPPNFAVTDWFAYQRAVADNYIAALRNSAVGHIVLLSSIGAHLRKGAGPIDGLGYLEEQLQTLQNKAVRVLRPSYFYHNLLAQIGLVKNAGIMGANFGSTDEKLVLVHPADIAAAALEELQELKFEGYSIRYVSSDERHPQEIAAVLGSVIGKPGLPWITFTDEQSLEGMKGAGLSDPIAEGYTTMGAAIRNGNVQEDYWKSNKVISGTLKLEDFAREFAAAYLAN